MTMTAATARVEVLNASYQPLTSTTLDRAIALYITKRADIEESDPFRRVRHKNGWLPWPKVIRMVRYISVNIEYGPEPWSKAGVLKRDDYKCAYCTKRRGETIDHILPRAQGGQNTWENTVASCKTCNNKKDNRTPEQANMELLFKPTVPKRFHFAKTGKSKKK